MPKEYNLDDSQRDAYEKYLLAGRDQAKAMAAMEQLVEGSDAYNYLFYIHTFNTVGWDGLAEDKREKLN